MAKAKKAPAAEVLEEVDEEVEALFGDEEEPDTDDDGAPVELKSSPLDELYEDGDEVLSAKAAATRLGTDGRTLRKFLRARYGHVGQGARWVIGESKIDGLKGAFAEFSKPKIEVKAIVAPTNDDESEDLDELLEIE